MGHTVTLTHIETETERERKTEAVDLKRRKTGERSVLTLFDKNPVLKTNSITIFNSLCENTIQRYIMAQRMTICTSSSSSSSRMMKNQGTSKALSSLASLEQKKRMSSIALPTPKRVLMPHHRQVASLRAAKDSKATAESMGDTETLAGVVFRHSRKFNHSSRPSRIRIPTRIRRRLRVRISVTH